MVTKGKHVVTYSLVHLGRCAFTLKEIVLLSFFLIDDLAWVRYVLFRNKKVFHGNKCYKYFDKNFYARSYVTSDNITGGYEK